ncbi:unnamed protein product [Cercospora beticola]|nr:unnamed protein product [Cercospora beticola]
MLLYEPSVLGKFLFSFNTCIDQVINHDLRQTCCLCNSDLYVGGHLVFPAGNNCPVKNEACGPPCTWNDTCCWRRDPKNGNAATCWCYAKAVAHTSIDAAQKDCGFECAPDWTPIGS